MLQQALFSTQPDGEARTLSPGLGVAYSGVELLRRHPVDDPIRTLCQCTIKRIFHLEGLSLQPLLAGRRT